MKLRLSDIPPEGLRVSGTLDLDRLNARMAEGRDNEIVFTSPPQVELRVWGSPRGAETKGRIFSRYRQPCSRCLKTLDLDLEVAADFLLKPARERDLARGRESADDIGVIYFENEPVDIEDQLQENLILALRPFLLPERDSQGRCSACGEVCPTQWTVPEPSTPPLSALLRKAGVN